MDSIMLHLSTWGAHNDFYLKNNKTTTTTTTNYWRAKAR